MISTGSFKFEGHFFAGMVPRTITNSVSKATICGLQPAPFIHYNHAIAAEHIVPEDVQGVLSRSISGSSLSVIVITYLPNFFKEDLSPSWFFYVVKKEKILKERLLLKGILINFISLRKYIKKISLV